MKDLVIIILIIILIIAIFYILLLKRAIRKFTIQLNKKVANESNIVLTSEINDKDLKELINSINKNLKNINDKKIDYDNKNKMLKKMMTNISHDLRTPLTSALGYIDIVINSNLSKDEQLKELHIIEDRLNRLNELIDSFFEFSKIISSNQIPEINEINLIDVLETSIAHYYDDYINSKRIIVFDNYKKIKINSNKEMLLRTFDNLIANAYKHSNGDLKIKVETNKKIKITFENDLINNEIDIDHIFDEFYTIDISRTKGNTGLGLAIAKEFVEQLNGTIIAKKKKEKLLIIIEVTI